MHVEDLLSPLIPKHKSKKLKSCGMKSGFWGEAIELQYITLRTSILVLYAIQCFLNVSGHFELQAFYFGNHDAKRLCGIVS